MGQNDEEMTEEDIARIEDQINFIDNTGGC